MRDFAPIMQIASARIAVRNTGCGALAARLIELAKANQAHQLRAPALDPAHLSGSSRDDGGIKLSRALPRRFLVEATLSRSVQMSFVSCPQLPHVKRP